VPELSDERPFELDTGGFADSLADVPDVEITADTSDGVLERRGYRGDVVEIVADTDTRDEPVQGGAEIVANYDDCMDSGARYDNPQGTIATRAEVEWTVGDEMSADAEPSLKDMQDTHQAILDAMEPFTAGSAPSHEGVVAEADTAAADETIDLHGPISAASDSSAESPTYSGEKIYEEPIAEEDIPGEARNLLASIPVHPDTQWVTYAVRLDTDRFDHPLEKDAAVHYVRREDNPDTETRIEWGVWYNTFRGQGASEYADCYRNVVGFERRFGDLENGPPIDYSAQTFEGLPPTIAAFDEPTAAELEQVRQSLARPR
jgi:hypothetical protein